MLSVVIPSKILYLFLKPPKLFIFYFFGSGRKRLRIHHMLRAFSSYLFLHGNTQFLYRIMLVDCYSERKFHEKLTEKKKQNFIKKLSNTEYSQF
jgi:hypothetical protein